MVKSASARGKAFSLIVVIDILYICGDNIVVIDMCGVSSHL